MVLFWPIPSDTDTSKYTGCEILYVATTEKTCSSIVKGSLIQYFCGHGLGKFLMVSVQCFIFNLSEEKTSDLYLVCTARRNDNMYEDYYKHYGFEKLTGKEYTNTSAQFASHIKAHNYSLKQGFQCTKKDLLPCHHMCSSINKTYQT